MRRVAAVFLGALAGGISAGGFKVFLLNTGPAAAGANDWFVLTWLGSTLAGATAALDGSPVRGLLVGLTLAIVTALALQVPLFRPDPSAVPMLVTGTACLIAGFVGGLFGRSLRRPGRRAVRRIEV